MTPTRMTFAGLIGAGTLVAAACFAAVPCAADPLDSPGWQLDTPQAKPATGKAKAGKQATKAGRKQAPAASSEEADRAARLAEGRRKFFENKPEPESSGKVGDFGGYNYKTDSPAGDGGFRPGATFKF